MSRLKTGLSAFIILLVSMNCKSPTYKKLVGEWNIDKLKLEIKDGNGNIVKDTTFADCGKFVFYEITEGRKKERKGKIEGYVEEPKDIVVDGKIAFVPGIWWFNGDARASMEIEDDIGLHNYTEQKYKVIKRKGKTITLEHSDWDNLHHQIYTLTKK